jgi:hypothetical protein
MIKAKLVDEGNFFLIPSLIEEDGCINEGRLLKMFVNLFSLHFFFLSASRVT